VRAVHTWSMQSKPAAQSLSNTQGQPAYEQGKVPSVRPQPKTETPALTAMVANTDGTRRRDQGLVNMDQTRLSGNAWGAIGISASR